MLEIGHFHASASYLWDISNPFDSLSLIIKERWLSTLLFICGQTGCEGARSHVVIEPTGYWLTHLGSPAQQLGSVFRGVAGAGPRAGGRRWGKVEETEGDKGKDWRNEKGHSEGGEVCVERERERERESERERERERDREREREKLTVARWCYHKLSRQQSISFSVTSDRSVHYLYAYHFL